MKQVMLTAEKMSCGHCKQVVENAAGALSGVKAVSADPETKKIQIAYDEKAITLEEIKKAIEQAGYPAQ